MRVDPARALRMAMVVEAAMAVAEEIRDRARWRFEDYCRGDPIEDDDRALAVMRFGDEPWRAMLTPAEMRMLAACDLIRPELGEAREADRQGPQAP